MSTKAKKTPKAPTSFFTRLNVRSEGWSEGAGLSARQWVTNRAWMDANETFGEDGAPVCANGHKRCSTAKTEGGPCLKEMTAVAAGKAYRSRATKAA